MQINKSRERSRGTRGDWKKERKTERFFKDCITYVININRPFSVDGVKFVKKFL